MAWDLPPNVVNGSRRAMHKVAKPAAWGHAAYSVDAPSGDGGDARSGDRAYTDDALCAIGRLPSGGDPAYNLPAITKDALAGKRGEYEVVLANPPFGKKSSLTIVNEAGEQEKESLVINREDF